MKMTKLIINLAAIISISIFAMSVSHAKTITKTLELPNEDVTFIIRAAKEYGITGSNIPTPIIRNKAPNTESITMSVLATAYTSHANQTDSTPMLAAWNNRIEPGMKLIAVSRDMLTRYGMKNKTKVRIEGFEGEYLVLDKMNKRWKRKIDIYMGMDLEKAFKWGIRTVNITFVPEY